MGRKRETERLPKTSIMKKREEKEKQKDFPKHVLLISRKEMAGNLNYERLELEKWKRDLCKIFRNHREVWIDSKKEKNVKKVLDFLKQYCYIISCELWDIKFEVIKATNKCAEVAELADAQASGACGR